MNQEVMEANSQEPNNTNSIEKRLPIETQIDNEIPKPRARFYQNKKIILFTLLLLSTVIVTFALNRIKEEKTDSLQKNQEAFVATKENNSFVLQPIERKINKIAFINGGNIWIVNPDGTELEQLTNIDYNLSVSKTELNNYKRSFFSIVSWSPDGSHLAAAAINNTVKKVLESKDGEMKKDYLLNEGYWFPSHLDLYIFDVINKTSKTLDLENFDLDAQKPIQILGIDWLPDNNNIFLKIQNNDNIVLDTSDLTKAPIKVPSTVVRGGIDTDLYEAYVPEVEALFSDSIFHASAKDVQISGTRLNSNSIMNLIVYDLPGERQRSFIVPGNDGNIYFHTLKNGFINLHRYNVISNKDDIILSKPDCGSSKQNLKDLCIELPNVAEGFTSSFDEQFISPNGKYVVARINNKENIGIYRTEDLKLVYSIIGKNIDSFKWSSDGESILQLIGRNRLSVVNLDNGREVVVTKKQLDFFSGSNNYDWNSLH